MTITRCIFKMKKKNNVNQRDFPIFSITFISIFTVLSRFLCLVPEIMTAVSNCVFKFISSCCLLDINLLFLILKTNNWLCFLCHSHNLYLHRHCCDCFLTLINPFVDFTEIFVVLHIMLWSASKRNNISSRIS